MLPIQSAEELLGTLPGVLSARILTDATGSVASIHVLTGPDVAPKSTVRNVESALVAHFALQVDHRKISVATSTEPARVSGAHTPIPGVPQVDGGGAAAAPVGRRLYFEDVEVRRSRSTGVSVRVTLSKGDESFHGDAVGAEHDRAWIELAASAALAAIMKAEGTGAALALYGVKLVEAFDREFVFVGINARLGRESVLLTGSCEVKDSVETASALAVLDATNRWLAQIRARVG